MIRQLLNPNATVCAAINYITVPPSAFLCAYMTAILSGREENKIAAGFIGAACVLVVVSAITGFVIRNNPEERATFLRYVNGARNFYSRLNRFSFFRDPISEPPQADYQQVNIRMEI